MYIRKDPHKIMRVSSTFMEDGRRIDLTPKDPGWWREQILKQKLKYKDKVK